jgi:hypothetical protein
VSAAVALVACAVWAAPAAGQQSFLPLEDVRPGAVATVRTVLSGTEIEEFEVEIVSVVHDTGPDQDMIVARGLGDRIAHLGVAQGMSGSPVYVEGRLVGALSSTWSFLKEPLLGITPAEQMAREADWSFEHADVSAAPFGPGSGGRGLGLPAASSGELSAAAELARRIGLPEPPAAPSPEVGASPDREPHGFAAIGAPLVLSGLDPRLAPVATGLFEPWGFRVAEGGTGGSEPGAPLEPGATVGVRLAGGDANLTAIGTVTWVDGDRVYAWGHPFFQVGDVEFPLVNGYIHTVMPSQLISFKLGSGGDVVGTCVSDRRSGISGYLGREPRLIDFDITLGQRGNESTFHYRIVRHRDLSPTLVGLTATNSVLVREGGLREETVRFRQRIELDDGRETTVETMLTGDRNLGAVTQLLGAATRLIATNPFEDVGIRRIDANIDSEPGIRATFLMDVSLDDRSPRPGDTLRGGYTLRDYRGGESRGRWSIPLPETAREGRYLLLLADARTADEYEAERNPRRYAPRSLDEMLERMDDLRAPDRLYVHLYRQTDGVLIDGRPLPDLPPSARAVIGGTARSGPAEELPAEIVHESSIPLERLVQGAHTILFEVREEKP